MRHFSPQDVVQLRDSQLNAFASLGVYAAVWILLQLVLTLARVEMPLVRVFDQYGHFSLVGGIVTVVLLASAFLPHKLLLWKSGLSWREGARLIRDFNEGLVESADPEEVRRTPRPSPEAFGLRSPGATEDNPDYWDQRWAEVIKPLSDEDSGARE